MPLFGTSFVHCVMDVHSAMGGDRYLQLLFQKKKPNGLQTIFFSSMSVGKFVANVTIVNFNNFMDKSHHSERTARCFRIRKYFNFEKYFSKCIIEFYFTIIIKIFQIFCIISANFMSNSQQMIVVQNTWKVIWNTYYFSTKFFLYFHHFISHQFLH